MVRPRVTLKMLMVAVLLGAVALAALRYASAAWAGAVLLGTQAVLGLAILGVVYRRGARRAFWLGFALFGWGYLFQLVGAANMPPTFYPCFSRGGPFGGMVSDSEDSQAFRPVLSTVLDLLYPMVHQEDEPGKGGSFLAWLGTKITADTATLRALETPVPMPFGAETPLEDALKYIKSATQSPELPQGIRIYVNPLGLQEAERTLQSPIMLELEGVPLRKSLKLMLKQLDLTYEVEEGLVKIDSIAAGSGSDEAVAAFHAIGHCGFALLAGVLGGLGGVAFHARGQRALPLPEPVR